MSAKPLIGITVESKHAPQDDRSHGEIRLNWNYAEMVSLAGGVPLVLPPTSDTAVIAGLIDGWLIPGGMDIDAARFGEENHPMADLQDPSRYDFESCLFDRVPNELPILGICYGCQFLNVKMGGALEQHIPDRTGNGHHSSGELAEYSIEGGSKLASIVGPSVMGRSYHHQAVSKLAEGLSVNAHHADGTVEGVEVTARPFVVGVQWHPERTPDDEGSQRLFAAFVEAAATYRRNRIASMTERFVRDLVPHLERVGADSASDIASAIEARYLAVAEGAAKLFESVVRTGGAT